MGAKREIKHSDSLPQNFDRMSERTAFGGSFRFGHAVIDFRKSASSSPSVCKCHEARRARMVKIAAYTHRSEVDRLDERGDGLEAIPHRRAQIFWPDVVKVCHWRSPCSASLRLPRCSSGKKGLRAGGCMLSDIAKSAGKPIKEHGG